MEMKIRVLERINLKCCDCENEGLRNRERWQRLWREVGKRMKK